MRNTRRYRILKFVINGFFLYRTVTGVQRYAYELIQSVDKWCTGDMDIELLVPNIEIKKLPKLKHIKLKRFAKCKSQTIWEQFYFFFYLLKNRAIGINLCNAFPFLKPDITVIHDVYYKTFKIANFPDKSLKKLINIVYMRLMYLMAFVFSKCIITVSEFSKSEIMKYYPFLYKEIHVIYNGWQHFNLIKEDNNVFKLFPQLASKQYFFSLGSLLPNKNIDWVLNVAQKSPQYMFAISGHDYTGNTHLNIKSPNVLYLGYLSDGQVKALMRHCKAFVFPSLYEGFGIPPLEALSVGASVIISNRACLPEIYKNGAHYIDAQNTDVDLESLLSQKVDDPEKILDTYSWEKSAKKLYDLLRAFK